MEWSVDIQYHVYRPSPVLFGPSSYNIQPSYAITRMAWAPWDGFWSSQVGYNGCMKPW